MSSTGYQEQEAVLNTASTHLDPFREIIDRFGLLLGRQAETRAWLTPVDLGAFVVDEERFLSGEPLVGFMNPELMVQPFRLSASRMWPALGVIFPSLSESLAGLGGRFLQDDSWVLTCMRSVILNDAGALESVAAQAGLDRPGTRWLVAQGALPGLRFGPGFGHARKPSGSI